MEDMIKQCVDDVWEIYDEDRGGSLDRDECKAFVLDMLQVLNENFDPDRFDDDLFDKQFRVFDLDRSGTLEKNEMAALIKNLSAQAHIVN